MRLAAPRKETENQTDTPHKTNPAILFDLDGTLLDSNYEHVIAWRLSLRRAGVEIPNAFLHRCIGMPGVKVVYMSGYTAGYTATLLGMQKFYLTKPFTRDKLLGTIRQALEAPF